ncbi:RRQRL motif-containing zinc-binding protein [Streptomyces sp. NPDC050355]|uniref:RRQRL motif-containing zinc-binding protein n=1 Tax=Streptomyces sp. NPDC050355 TaxID=3365609 RepID=UPI0037B36E9E
MTTGTVLPTYAYRLAPDGLLTRRQLRARGLRPGGCDPVGQIVWRRGQRVAYLYRADLARPVRPMTPALWRSHASMMRARRTCGVCGVVRGYVIPRSRGCCNRCAGD